MSKSFQMPTTERYAGKSTDATATTDERGVTFYFSYRTLIGVRLPDGTLFVRTNDWGPTTGRHLNAIKSERDHPRLDGNAFVNAVGDALASLGAS